MDAWVGLERLLNLSMGTQVGASGVALIAVLELKRRLQHSAEFQGQSPTSSCIVRLTAEEWRSVAGIHVRKTFERTKAKLEELGILRIVRNGKLLEVTLWPDQESTLEVGFPEGSKQEEFKSVLKSETQMASQSGLQVKQGKIRNLKLRLLACTGEISRVAYETDSETSNETSCGTSNETRIGTSNETGTVSPSERDHRSREDGVFPRPDVTKNVAYPTLLDKHALLRYPLNRNYNKIHINNVSNEATKNEQRCNEGVSLLEFAIHWVQEVGHALTPYEKDGLVRFQRLGYTEELFVEALRCAVAADNRRMGYVLGILRNWHEQGVRCLQDVAAIRESWEDLRFLKRAKIG